MTDEHAEDGWKNIFMIRVHSTVTWLHEKKVWKVQLSFYKINIFREFKNKFNFESLHNWWMFPMKDLKEMNKLYIYLYLPVSILILVGLFSWANNFHPFLKFRSKHCNLNLLVTHWEGALNEVLTMWTDVYLVTADFYMLSGLINEVFMTCLSASGCLFMCASGAEGFVVCLRKSFHFESE